MKYSKLALATIVPVALLFLFMAALQTKASPSATFIVNSTVDAVDVNPGDGVCETAVPGQCTLRAAVMEANALPGSDSIFLSANTFILSIAGQEEDAAASGDIDITDSLSINGVSANTTIIDGSMIDRVFHITETNNITVSFSDLTIRNGGFNSVATVPDTNGGGIYNALPTNAVQVSDVIILSNSALGDFGSGLGGGIYNAGSLEISNSEVLSNTSFAGHGIYNDGTLIVTNTTFAHNFIAGIGGQGGTINNNALLLVQESDFYKNYSYFGGGVYNAPSANATLNSVNIYSNTVYLDGGGIFNFGIITLTNSTIYTNNTTSSRGGGIFNFQGNLLITNSTVHNNDAMSGFASGGGIYLMEPLSQIPMQF